MQCDSRACGTHGRDEKCIRNVGKLEGKKPFGRPVPIWEDIFKIDLNVAGCEGVDWFT
jgi:hypothetical protein